MHSGGAERALGFNALIGGEGHQIRYELWCVDLGELALAAISRLFCCCLRVRLGYGIWAILEEGRGWGLVNI
jgi:hypothetical protein